MTEKTLLKLPKQNPEELDNFIKMLTRAGHRYSFVPSYSGSSSGRVVVGNCEWSFSEGSLDILTVLPPKQKPLVPFGDK